MQRRKFIKGCCYTAVGIPLAASILQSCGTIYYATASREKETLIVNKSEFFNVKKNKTIDRNFVLLKVDNFGFPISLYKENEESYIASFMECTHKSCELNLGGGVYSCPCHGSEFSATGKVISGPAYRDLKTFRTEIDNDKIYIYLS